MLTRKRRLSVTVRLSTVLALVAASVTLTAAAPAAAEVPPTPVTLGITTATTKGFKVGDPVSFTYTATNTTAAPLTLPANAAVMATYHAQYDDPTSKPVWTGPCEPAGFGDLGDFVVFQDKLLLPSTLAPGASVSCTLTYPATKFDVTNGGVWTELFYVDDPETSWRWSAGWWYGIASASATGQMLTITGTPTVGSTLTAVRGFWGTWDTPTAYQWLRDGAEIPGATTSTYVPVSADIGHAISVKNTARSSHEGSEVTRESSRTAPVTAAPTAPSPIPLAPAPTLAGAVKVGQVVTAKPGAWTPGTAFTFRWKLSGATIPGATKSTYVVPAVAAGKTLTAVVTGTKSGYTAVTTSSAGHKVAAGTLVMHKPSISGTAKVGRSLTVKPGSWTAGTALHYRWYASGKAIPAATGKSLRLTSALRAKTITVKVTGTKAGYATASSTSSKTKPVAK